METMGNISAWLTPAIIIGLFLWLRADITNTREELRTDFRAQEARFEKRFENLEERFDKRFAGMDERIRALESGQAEIRGQRVILRDYILGGNLREPEEAPEAAPGD